MARITPPPNAKGFFQVREPFAVTPSMEYRVTAIRSFDELRNQGIRPNDLIYLPAGLGEEDYQRDRAEGAFIVTLQSATEKPKYIPDTYILSFPEQGAVPYSWLVASVSLGPFPDSYDTALLEEKLSSVVSDYIGVTPTVQISRAATTESITDEQHEDLTLARQSMVKHRETDHGIALRQEAIIQQQAERIRLLEGIIMANKA